MFPAGVMVEYIALFLLPAAKDVFPVDAMAVYFALFRSPALKVGSPSVELKDGYPDEHLLSARSVECPDVHLLKEM